MSKDETLNQIKSETTSKLQEQSEAIDKEKKTKTQVEEEMHALKQQLENVQKEYSDQKEVGEHLVEEQQKRMKEEFEMEKQALELKKKQELDEKANIFASTLEQKEESLKRVQKDSDVKVKMK